MLAAGLAWTFAVAHGAGGRPTSLIGAVAAWAVMAGLALAAPWARGFPSVPAGLAIAFQVVLAPWLARLVGLRGEWWTSTRDAAVVWLSLAMASVLVRRAGRRTDDGRSGGHRSGDHRAGTDGDVVADLASR